MARRNNNRLGTWGNFRGGTTVSLSPSYYWARRGPRVNQMEGSPSADTSKWLLPDFNIDDEGLPLFPTSAIGGFVLVRPAPLDSEEMPAPHLDDGDNEPPRMLLGLVRRRSFRAADDEPSFVVSEEDGAPAHNPRVRRLVALVPPAADEAAFPVSEEDGATKAARLQQLARPGRPLGADEEMAFPVSEEDGVSPHNPKVRRLLRPVPPHADDDVLITGLDTETAPFVRPLLRLVYKAPRPVDSDDGLPSGGPPPPPPPKPPFVPTVGQTGDQSAPGGGGEHPSPSDWELDDEHTIYQDDEEAAETVGLAEPEPAGEPEAQPEVEDEPEAEAEVKPVPVSAIKPELAPPPEAPRLAAIATSLSIFVRATILNVGVMKHERGNIVYFVAPFRGPPDEVFFSYLAPGSSTPIVDSGFGAVDSNIKRVRPETLLQLGYVPEKGFIYYIYAVDTTGMRGGKIVVHFWGTGKFQASGFSDDEEIKDRPRQLL